MRCAGAPVYFAGFLRYSILRSDSGKIVVCAGVLGRNKAFALEPGQQ